MKTLLTFGLFLFCTTVLSHKYYVAVVNMEWNAADERIDVFVKATAHDFQGIMERALNKRIDLDTIPKNDELMKFTSDYLQKTFSLTSLEIPATFNYIGSEVTERLNIFFYFTFTDVLNPKKIKITCKFFFEYFKGQQNIIHYKHGDQTKSVTLVASSAEGEFKFE